MSKLAISLALLVTSIVVVALAPSPTYAQACASTNEIVDPAPFTWTYVATPEPHYVGVMEYGEATFSINGESLTTRAYRQEGGAYSIPGPTMTMVPGNTYVLRFRNVLTTRNPLRTFLNTAAALLVLVLF